MNGRIVGVGIVLTAIVTGTIVYWLQEYAYYSEVVFTPGQEIVLTPISGAPQAIPVRDIRGIDGSSSPLRFRACFTSDISLATLTEGFKVYEAPTPLNAPGWFSCFDAGAITAALASGEAVAFLGQANVAPNSENVEIDRVVAVFPDGRAFAWNQLSPGTEP